MTARNTKNAMERNVQESGGKSLTPPQHCVPLCSLRSEPPDRWTLMVDAMAGEPPMPLPNLPGRVHRSADRQLTPDELAGVTSPSELALLLGCSRQAASVRLRKAITDTLAPARRPVIRLPARKGAP